MRGYAALCLALSASTLMSMKREPSNTSLLPMPVPRAHYHTDSMFKGSGCCISSMTSKAYVMRLFKFGLLTAESRDASTGNTLLHAKMIYQEQFPLSVTQLLKKGCSIKKANSAGKTALDLLDDRLAREKQGSKTYKQLERYSQEILNYYKLKTDKRKPSKNRLKAFLCCCCLKRSQDDND